MWIRVTALTLLASLFVAGEAAANPATGVWKTDDGRANVKISECGNGLCANIIWLREPRGDNGRPLHDARNPNPRLRSRPIMGLPLMEHLTQAGRNLWTGQIYNPEDGKSYPVEVTLLGERSLQLRGCTSWGWPCRTKVWSLVERNAPKRANEPQMVQKETPKPAPRHARPAPEMASVAAIPGLGSRPASPDREVASTHPLPQPMPNRHAHRAESRQQRQITTASLPEQRAPEVAHSVQRLPDEPNDAMHSSIIPDSAFLVQIAASRDADGAKVAYNEVRNRHPELIGNYRPDIQRVDLGEKGVWYRVRVGPMAGKDAAVDMCMQLKAEGGDCLVRRN